MDSDAKFYVYVFSLVAIVLIGITFLITVDDVYSASRVTTLVAHGARPVEARCAVYGSSGDKFDCNILLSK